MLSPFVKTAVAFVGCVFVASAMIAAPPAPDTPLTVKADEMNVTVTGLDAAAQVVLFAEIVQTERGLLHRYDIEKVLTADESGAATYSPAGGVAFRSVWVAVEVSSGRYGTGAREAFPLVVHPVNDILPKNLSTEITVETSSLLAMLVSPARKAAWVLHEDDGRGHGRGGQKDGVVRLDFNNATLVAGTNRANGNAVPSAPGVPEFANGNVLVAIDCRTLEVTVGTVGR
jgi:hypothetical protein